MSSNIENLIQMQLPPAWLANVLVVSQVLVSRCQLWLLPQCLDEGCMQICSFPNWGSPEAC